MVHLYEYCPAQLSGTAFWFQLGLKLQRSQNIRGVGSQEKQIPVSKPMLFYVEFLPDTTKKLDKIYVTIVLDIGNQQHRTVIPKREGR